MAETTRKHLFRIFFALLTTISTGSSIWAYSLGQNQDCTSNGKRIAFAQSHQQIGALPQVRKPAIRPATFTQAEQVGALQPSESGGSGDARTAVPRVTPSSTEASEAGSNTGPQFFLIIGSVLIGVRVIISHRSRKVKKLAAETN